MKWRIIVSVKKITNPHFQNFKEAVNICCGNPKDDDSILSDMKSASYAPDDERKYFYSQEYLPDFINMETIKLDEFTEQRKIMLELSGDYLFEQLPAVDAVCIDRNNEWFLIEFKNGKVDNKISSIKSKMQSSLWFCFYILSKSNKDDGVLSDDVLKFSREHVSYIVVGRRDDNMGVSEIIKEAERCHEHYQPHKLKQFINYYFKDVYMLTEYEFRKFILEFKA
jgi:hypothetical protein